MRVTNNMMTNNMMFQIHRLNSELLAVQEKISSQKRINRPSDDPFGTSRVLDFRSTIAVIDQYQDNISTVKTRIEVSEAALGFVDDLLAQARGVAQNNSNPDISAEKRQLAAAEVKDIYDQIMQMANSKFGNAYMFGGHKTDTEPYSRDANYVATYGGDNGDVRFIIGENSTISMDANGENIFNPDLDGDGSTDAGAVDIFLQLKNLIDGLEMADPVAGAAAIQATTEPLWDAREQVNNKRSEYGPKINRLDITEKYWAHLRPQLRKAITNIEAADLPKAIMELQILELSYRTTLATTAKIIQPTLMDFLK
jgi:flagellar hook-associated protein 3 FlgL